MCSQTTNNNHSYGGRKQRYQRLLRQEQYWLRRVRQRTGSSIFSSGNGPQITNMMTLFFTALLTTAMMSSTTTILAFTPYSTYSNNVYCSSRMQPSTAPSTSIMSPSRRTAATRRQQSRIILTTATNDNAASKQKVNDEISSNVDCISFKVNGDDNGFVISPPETSKKEETETPPPYDQYYSLDQLNEINSIVPKTRSLPKSMTFFANYVIQYIMNNRRVKQEQVEKLKAMISDKKKQKATKKNKIKDFISMMKLLNEQRRNVVRLAGYNRGIVVPSFAFLLLGALTTAIEPHYYSQCISHVASAATLFATSGSSAVESILATKNKLIISLLGLGISSTLAALFTGIRGSLFWIAGSRANYNVRVKLHHNLLLQEATFFDSNEVGYLLSRLNNDVNKIGMVISFHVNVILRQVAQFIFGSIYLLKISSKLSMYTFAGITAVAYVSAIYGNFSRILSEKVQNTFADSTAVAETSFSMSETIRSFNGLNFETNKYEKSQNLALDLEEVQAWSYGTHKLVSDVLQSVLQIFLLWSCYMVGTGTGYGNIPTLSVAKLTSFMFYSNFVLESSNEVGDQWAKIQSAIGASSNVFDLIRRIPSIRDPIPVAAADGIKVNNATNAAASTATTTSTTEPTAATAATETQGLLKPKTRVGGIGVDGVLDHHLFECEEDNNNGITCHVVPNEDDEEMTTLPTKSSNDNVSLSSLVEEYSKPIVKMTDMTVTYRSMSKSTPALKNINLNIYPGDRIAIIGRSGSGKSSMLRSLMRFYDPSSGNVEMSSKFLKDMSRKEIASHISIVEQEPHLFPMTLIDNILYGLWDEPLLNNEVVKVNDDELEECHIDASAKEDNNDSGCSEYIYSDKVRNAVENCLELAGLSVKPGNALNLNLDTRVGDGGRTLSGGQRQRVAIARALIRSPEILLLDEPTAALDSESEKNVVNALQKVMEHTTAMVMVTHRLGCIRSLNINRVIVLDKGAIIESGHPETLLDNASSEYYKMAKEQGITSLNSI